MSQRHLLQPFCSLLQYARFRLLSPVNDFVSYRACLSSRTSSCSMLTILTGEAVTLYGTSGPSSGPYSVQLDGGHTVQYNASNAYPTNYGVTIYHADNLGPGVHQILLTNLPDTSGQYLTIDYAQLWSIAKCFVTPPCSVRHVDETTFPSSSTSPSPSVISCIPPRYIPSDAHSFPLTHFTLPAINPIMTSLHPSTWSGSYNRCSLTLHQAKSAQAQLLA